MGNAFAAITVMTVGIGAPFVFSQGANPALIGMVAFNMWVLWHIIDTDGCELQHRASRNVRNER